MFANEDFIQASRKFVCIRIETFENKQSEMMVRELLNGRFANTAFMIFDPSGKRKLVRAGRSPASAVGGRGERKAKRGQFDPDEVLDDDAVIQEMQEIAARFTPAGKDTPSFLQDFNSFRQALNVASADQRLLVCVDVNANDRSQAEDKLKQVFSSADVVGKFHLNFLDPDVDGNWAKSINGETSPAGIFIIRSGTFGIDGVVMQRIELTQSADEIKAALVTANDEYSFMETRKNYSQHVLAGRRQGIVFENEIPREGIIEETESKDRRRRRRK